MLLTEAPLQPRANREKMVQILFETFQCQNTYVVIQAVMALYAAGRTTGLVVDSGDGVTHTVPVYDAYSLPHAIYRNEIAGRRLTDYIQKLVLQHCGENMTSSSEYEILKDIKEKHCKVAETKESYDQIQSECINSSSHDQSYTLPDKRVITVKGQVRYGGPELLFTPTLDGETCDGIQTLTYKSINSADVETRKDLTKNIILSGGSTMFDGLAARLKKELENTLPAGTDVRILAEESRKFSVWIGASTLASLTSFSEEWFSKKEYDE